MNKTLSAFFCITVLAQQTFASEDNKEQIEIQESKNLSQNIQEMTVTAFRTPQESGSLPLSLAVANQSSLELNAHIHIQESVNKLPGVNFHRNSGQEYLAAIRSPVLTGAGSCGSILTAEDGLPLRPTGFCNVNQLFEAHTEAATSIEVLRGPGTAAYGSSAVHGVINVRNAAPLSTATQVGIEAGAYGFGRLRLSGGNDDLAAALTLSRDGGYRDESGYNQQKLSIRHQANSGELKISTGFTATNLDQETAGFLVGTDAYRDENLARRNPNPEAFRKARAARFYTSIEDSSANWQLKPYARYSDMEFLQHFLPGQPLEENGHSSFGLLSHWIHQFDDQLEVITGLDLEFADTWLTQSQDQPTQGSAFLQETIPQGLHYNYEVSSQVVGPYVHANWQINEQFELGLGARLEHLNYDYDNLLLDGRRREDGTSCGFGGCRYSRPADRDDSFTNFSPKFSIRYQWTDASSLYFNASNGFRAPEITELYRLQRNQSVAELDAEEVNSLEIGWRYRNRQVSAHLALFDMDKSNVILRDVDFFNLSDGKTSHKGFEAQFAWQLAERWALEMAATYAAHKYENNPGLSRIDIVGKDIDTAPRHFGSTRLVHEFGKSTTESRIELEWQHVGRYFTDPENLHTYPGHDLFHLRAIWQPNGKWTGSLRLNNLLNTPYAERADFTGFSGDRYFPGQPRRIYLGISCKL